MQGKKIGLVLVAVGIVLILAALGLALRNQQEDHAAGEQALQLFHQLQGLQRQQTPEESQSEAAVEDAALPVVEIDGYGYIRDVDDPCTGIGAAGAGPVGLYAAQALPLPPVWLACDGGFRHCGA